MTRLVFVYNDGLFLSKCSAGLPVILAAILAVFTVRRALSDAERAIFLAPGWPKGYFRKGRALAGMKVSLPY